MEVQKIVLGGGCFWCLDAFYRNIEGVAEVVSGYSAGETKNPTYEDICRGNTGHAEVVEVAFNPKIINLQQILQLFFKIHNPTTLNRQGADVGTQYRSVILYEKVEDLEIIKNAIKLAEAEWGKGKIATQVQKLSKFYKAENYHQNYYNKNPGSGYCQLVIKPKLAKTNSVL